MKRSHPWFLAHGLEWLPRLLQEPRRLWRRMFISAPLLWRASWLSELEDKRDAKTRKAKVKAEAKTKSKVKKISFERNLSSLADSIFESTSQPMKNNREADEILAKLFGSVSRARIIEFLVLQVGRAFYQREIMFETGLSLHPTQRELENLVDLEIVKKRETKDRVYYEIDIHSAFFKPLCEICESAQKSNKKSKSQIP